MPESGEDMRLLLPETDAQNPVRLHVLLSGQLLPATNAQVLLARQLPELSLSAVERGRNGVASFKVDRAMHRGLEIAAKGNYDGQLV